MTIAHSRTVNLEEIIGRADIVVAAVGRAEMVKGSWIKPGAVVIDVGINSVDDATKKTGSTAMRYGEIFVSRPVLSLPPSRTHTHTDMIYIWI